MSNHDYKYIKVTYERYVTKRDVNRTKCGFCLLREGTPKKLLYIVKCFVVSNNMYMFLFKNKNLQCKPRDSLQTCTVHFYDRTKRADVKL